MAKRQNLAPIFEPRVKKPKENELNQKYDSSPRERTFVAWNVAGVRAWTKKGGHSILGTVDADIVFLGETKCEESEFPPELNAMLKNYHTTLLPSKGKKGYAGVALFSKQKPLNVWKGTGIEEFDDAGRVIIAEYACFYFVGAYVLNSGNGLVNLEKRGRWEKVIREKLMDLDMKKAVVYGGDLNVAHDEIDLANPKSNANKTAGFTDQERQDLTKLLDSGFVDTFRKLHDRRASYTYWSFMRGARDRNIGWRLDYFLVSQRSMDNVRVSDMMDDEKKTSDHCPIILKIHI